MSEPVVRRDDQYWDWVDEALPFSLDGAADEVVILFGMLVSLIVEGIFDPEADWPALSPRGREVLAALVAAIDYADDRAVGRWN